MICTTQSWSTRESELEHESGVAFAVPEYRAVPGTAHRHIARLVLIVPLVDIPFLDFLQRQPSELGPDEASTFSRFDFHF